MPETGILNPRTGWDADIQDSMCPDYGFSNDEPNTRVRAKAPGGQPVTRETANDGHTFSFSWLNRSYMCVQAVRQFRNQYEDGYFTIIDRDGGGRHYVGRFTGKCQPVLVANDTWDLRDISFEEVPGAPMLEYPSDWQRDSIAIAAFNDFGTQNASTQGSWGASTFHATKTLAETAGTAGDTLTMEYKGYGFQVWMLRGPEFGQVSIALDGTVLAPLVDLYNNTDISPQMVYEHAKVSLDIHRVTVTLLGTKNGSATAAGAAFVKLQVMR